MIDENLSTLNPSEEKPPVRCAECDRVMEHYNVYISPTNEEKVVCWECMNRDDKGFLPSAIFGAVRGAV